MTLQHVPPERYPWWVKLTLFGSKTRRSQWLWVSFEFFVGLVLVYLALTETNAGARFLQVIAALWAFTLAAASVLTIRWMDRHGEWTQ
jgi:hypothetical protein